jgi:adenosylhomocysteine nucleosidase
VELTRPIDPQRPLLVCALHAEAAHLHAGDLPVLITGVGKVQAALTVTRALSAARPALIVNLGTAGALRDGLAGTHVIHRVIQHDLNSAEILALTGQAVGMPIDLSGHAAGYGGEPVVLATGDRFIDDAAARAQLAEHAHLVDMEGYAVAAAATAMNVPVVCVKEVSDSAGDEAAMTWSAALAACAERLGAWVDTHLR